MKNIFKNILLLSGLILFVACEKDEDKVVLGANARVESNLSTDSVVLTEATASQTAVTIAWEEKDLGVNLPVKYTVDLIIGDKTPKSISAEKSPLTITVKDLNDYVIDLGATAGQPTDVKVIVKLVLSDQRSLPSEQHTLKVTAYNTEIKPSAWGIVGSATPNEWNGPDIPFWNSENGTLVAYATLKNGHIKFRQNNTFDGPEYGGANGTLVSKGADIPVTAGTYKITFNEKALTYSLEKYSWGLIGNGANGWGVTDDIAMTYEGATNSWVVKNVSLKDGEVKFRLNNDWVTNFGADSTDDPATALEGNIASGGKNIKVTAGNYNVSFSFDANNKGTYKIEKL